MLWSVKNCWWLAANKPTKGEKREIARLSGNNKVVEAGICFVRWKFYLNIVTKISPCEWIKMDWNCNGGYLNMKKDRSLKVIKLTSYSKLYFLNIKMFMIFKGIPFIKIVFLKLQRLISLLAAFKAELNSWMKLDEIRLLVGFYTSCAIIFHLIQQSSQYYWYIIAISTYFYSIFQIYSLIPPRLIYIISSRQSLCSFDSISTLARLKARLKYF